MKDYIEELCLLTPNSKIVKSGNYVGDEYSYGYHLKDLIVGSRYSLGFVSEATLRLQRLRPFKTLLVKEGITMEEAKQLDISNKLED